MPQFLASDVNNPDFVGAVDPDKGLFVQFYMHEPLDQHKSQLAGKRVFLTKHVKDGPEQVNPANGLKFQPMRDTGEALRVPYVRIMKPGDNTTIIETEVREDHKRRWPNEWLFFQSQEGLVNEGDHLIGWKVDEWEHVKDDPETVRNLKHLRFYTVEQIASASDAQVQRLGMGGAGLREAAKQALRAKLGGEISKDLAAKDAEIAEMKERMAKLEAALMRPAQSPSAGAPDAGPTAGDSAAPRESILPPKQKRKYTRRAQVSG